MVGKTIAQYRIVGALGQGGMGEVWLADDTALGRKVALKFLPESLRHDTVARLRFLRESKSAAALDHPYICKIYEAGEIDGCPFIAMEYLEGRTLRDRLRQGPLPLVDAVQIAGEIAEALTEAHRRGIVHRDLKPANIFLTDQGHVKVVDFGLAKRVPMLEPSDGDPSLSQEGTLTEGLAVGTPAYMAPEQLRGRAVSPRSDIFSFGIVVYQMLTGINPFLKASTLETADAIRHDSEPPLARFRDDVPDLLQHTVRKMLSKDPRHRYQSCHEIRTDLAVLVSGDERSLGSLSRARRLRPAGRSGLMALAVVVLAMLAFWGARLRTEHVGPSAPAGDVEASVAVLPFADMSASGDLEYFCDGIAEQIISSLTRVENVRVTARTSAFAFRERTEDVREIGRQLGVDRLLEGSVRRVGGQLRITVQLVSTRDGFQLWSKDYDRELIDVLAIQDDIAREVAGALRIELGRGPEGLMARRDTEDPEAYNLYLKGRYLWNQRTQESLEAAIEHFERALDRDPDYALAYVGLADAYTLLDVYGDLSPAEANAKAKAAAARALVLDDTIAEAHASMGLIQEKERDWSGAARAYRRALELKPGYATARCWYAQLLAEIGKPEDAIAEVRRARELDPLSPWVNRSYGWILYMARRFDEAVRQLETALEMDPGSATAYETLVYIFIQEGRYEAAMAAARKADELRRPSPSEALGYTFAAMGETADARAVLDRLVEAWNDGRGSPGRIAVVYIGLGDRDRAFEWLETARRENDILLTQLKVDPLFDDLRDDPRFRALLESVGLDRASEEIDSGRSGA